ncbi:MAG: molybdopterin-dependent oxidoreductase, partial [Pseudomonadota bacterium]
MTRTRTTCPYCGVGCGVEARVEGGALIAVAGDEAHPANRGRLCVKGAALAESQHHQPLATQAAIDGRATSWRSAVHEAARRFGKVIAQDGPDAVAFYLSGQLLTEDYYVANKLMKGFIGSGNVDTNSRLCMASAVAAHKRAFGEDVVPVSYDDLEAAELIVLVGSNTAWAHPVIYQRIAAARAARGTKVVVIDPRRTATCDIADLHLPLRPGSDVALFNYLLTWLHDQGHTDQGFVTAHTQGAENTLHSARADVAKAAEHTGLSEATLEAFCELFAARRRTVTLFSQGVNQSDQGTDKANAIINCHLLTGRIGIAGAGPFSMTGQPNAMGGREVGGLATQLAAHMDFGAADRDRVQRFWQAPAVAYGPGLKAVDLFDAMAAGTIKAVWIMGTNPAVSLPDSGRIAQALERCATVIVSDCAIDTDTARYADVFLPALGWGEKDGTVTNSERVISRQRALRPATGTAQADWATICEFARALGFRRGFNFESPAEIFREHAALSAFENDGDRQFDLGPLAALSDDEYDALPPTRWPLNGPAFPEQRYSTASGRAQLVPVTQQPLASEAADTFILNSGRLRDQWHTMTRTGHTPRLFAHTGRPSIAL